ncbi:MAG: aminoglycoside phosphotransferase family protein [Flavobacteriales bacterium]
MNRQFEKSIANKFLATLGQKTMRITLMKSGMVHRSFLVETFDQDEYILQAVNTHVFHDLAHLATLQQEIASHLSKVNYPQAILKPVQFEGQIYLIDEQKGFVWRMFEGIKNSRNLERLFLASQSFEAAKSLSDLHFYLKNVQKQTLNNNHVDFFRSKHVQQTFIAIKETSNPLKTSQVNELIAVIEDFRSILMHDAIIHDDQSSCIHGDPKLNNFLYDLTGTSVNAIIDWDTFMFGSIYLDIAIMVSSFCIDQTEQASTAIFNEKMFHEILNGYNSGKMGPLLERLDRDKLFAYTQKVLLTQAIRFLADYLNGDVSFQAYDLQLNIKRCQDQLSLLKELLVFKQQYYHSKA